jgi:hypothetical protein
MLLSSCEYNAKQFTTYSDFVGDLVTEAGTVAALVFWQCTAHHPAGG